MNIGYAAPHNPERMYDGMLTFQRAAGLPGFLPMMDRKPAIIFDSLWVAMMLGGIEP